MDGSPPSLNHSKSDTDLENFKKSILFFLSSLPLLGGKASADSPGIQVGATVPDPDESVSLRPLNFPSDNLFAGHRSHSSHASHRSGSGGGYYSTPPPVQRQPPSGAPGQGQRLMEPGTAQPTDPGRAAPVSPVPGKPAQPSLSTAEKRTLQIMRVQLALTTLGLYSGPVNGVLDDSTQKAISHFQTVKGLETDGRMTTETLNALGVPAVQ